MVTSLVGPAGLGLPSGYRGGHHAQSNTKEHWTGQLWYDYTVLLDAIRTPADDQLGIRKRRGEKDRPDDLDGGTEDERLPTSQFVTDEHARETADHGSQIQTGIDGTLDERVVCVEAACGRGRIDLFEHGVHRLVGYYTAEEGLCETHGHKGGDDDHKQHELL
jgi:hypothetical protein